MNLQISLVVLVLFLPKNDAKNDDDNAFRDIVNSKHYVDKTSFIKYLHTKDSPVYLSAPRKFGKTLSLSMLKAFYEINVDENGALIPKTSTQNFKAFSKLATKPKINDTIFEDRAFFNTHFGSRPVFYLSFKTLNIHSTDAFLDSFKSMVFELYKKHSYVLMSSKIAPHDEIMFRFYTNMTAEKSEESLVTSGQTLTGILFRHFRKLCVVLIDEIDTPVFKLLTTHAADEKPVFRVIKDFLGALLNKNGAVLGAFLTGNTELAKNYINNADYIDHQSFTKDETARFLGFTKTEVRHLAGDSDLGEITRFYGGYRVENDGQIIFNPFSVIKYIETCKRGVYWSATGLNLKPLFQKAAVRKLIDDAIAGRGAIIERPGEKMEKLEFSAVRDLLTTQADLKVLESYQRDFLGQFLWDLGYLTLFKKVDTAFVELIAPNLEVRVILSEILSKSWMHHYGTNVRAVEAYAEAFEQLSNVSKRTKTSFKSSVCGLFSDILPMSEFELASTLHSFLLYSAKQCETLNVTTINGRANLLVSLKLKNGGHGIILGLRYKDCEGNSLLKELQEAGYEDVFQEKRYNNVKSYTLIGVCLNKANQFDFSFFLKD